MLRRQPEPFLRVLLMNKIYYVLTIFILSSNICFAAHCYLEKEYQNKWCKANNGTAEYILNDKTRIDCLTKDYAIEFDFASKWAESIGQALYYGLSTNKNAGVVLIMENPQKDIKYLLRLQEVAQKYNIKVWTMTPEDMQPVKNCAILN